MGWITRTVLGLAVLAALAVAGLLAYVWRVLPQIEGEIVVAGPLAPVRIERDAHGIPTLHAGSARDAAFALGFVHAQDRLWQLETHRRIGSGRLAEAFGEAALPNDRFIRALGVRRAAAEQWRRVDGEARELLQAYADGVNAVLRDTLRARPPEFVILGLQPEPWHPVDSLAWAIMMAWDLGGNWGTELLRLRLALQHPVARINELLPPYPGEKPLPTADYAALFRSLGLGPHGTAVTWSTLPDIAPPSGVEGVGSNNWVLSGTRSATGRPLLANDPHLRLTTPALWYFVRIVTPQERQAGASMAGVPSLVLGQNEHIAWGFTNTGPDVQDLYIEQVAENDDSRYRTPEGWAPFDSTAEIIRVKGKPDVTLRVRRTRHGPVISDAGTTEDLFGPAGARRHVLALRWTALDPDVDAVTVSLRMARAQSVAAFVAAAQEWVAPMQNMVVADRDGHIGFVAAGRVPVRKAGNDLHGLVPAPGWDARYDWAGWLPAGATPRSLDPPGGAIATANQRIHGPEYPHYLSSEWAPPYRQDRIEQMLAARPVHSIADLAAMQADVKSLAAPGLLRWLAQARSAHPLAAAAKRELEGFDGTMAAERAAPLILWAWSRRLAEAVFADDIGPTVWERGAGTRSFRDALEVVLDGGAGHWCDLQGTAEVEDCPQMVDLAFTRALQDLQERYGDDPARWQWGPAHAMRAEHRPFSRVPLLARLFELRVPTPGDTFTVNVSRVGLRPDSSTGELFLNEHGPSLRALYDLGDPRQSRFMHSSGQSGIVFSPWYRSFVQPWAAVQYLPLWEGQGPARVLALRPAPP